MSGTFNVSRDLWSDEAFCDDAFSEREAWIWLIAEASWKPRKKRVGDHIVLLDRGQLAHSTRFLAETWKWTHSKARRFLDRIEKLDLIRRETDTGVSVISICKYDEYQSQPQTTGTASAQDRHRTDTNEKKDEIREEGKEEDTYVSLSAPPDETSQAVEAFNGSAERAGWPKVQRLSKARISALRARLKEAGGIEGWQTALAKAEASDFLCGRVQARGSPPWRASFDFLLQASSFAKLLEGNYDNRDRPPEQASDPALRAIFGAVRSLEASGLDRRQG